MPILCTTDQGPSLGLSTSLGCSDSDVFCEHPFFQGVANHPNHPQYHQGVLCFVPSFGAQVDLI